MVRYVDLLGRDNPRTPSHWGVAVIHGFVTLVLCASLWTAATNPSINRPEPPRPAWPMTLDETFRSENLGYTIHEITATHVRLTVHNPGSEDHWFDPDWVVLEDSTGNRYHTDLFDNLVGNSGGVAIPGVIYDGDVRRVVLHYRTPPDTVPRYVSVAGETSGIVTVSLTPENTRLVP